MIDKDTTLNIIDAIVKNNYPKTGDKFAHGYYTAITSEADYFGHSFHRGVVQLLAGNHDTPERKYGMGDAVATTERIFIALGREDEIHEWTKRQRPEDITRLVNAECTCKPTLIGR